MVAAKRLMSHAPPPPNDTWQCMAAQHLFRGFSAYRASSFRPFRFGFSAAVAVLHFNTFCGTESSKNLLTCGKHGRVEEIEEAYDRAVRLVNDGVGGLVREDGSSFVCREFAPGKAGRNERNETREAEVYSRLKGSARHTIVCMRQGRHCGRFGWDVVGS